MEQRLCENIDYNNTISDFAEMKVRKRNFMDEYVGNICILITNPNISGQSILTYSIIIFCLTFNLGLCV